VPDYGGWRCIVFRANRLRTNLYDINTEQLANSLDRVKKAQEVMVREGIFSSESVLKARDRIHLSTDLKASLDGVEFVLETAPENLELKQELFGQVDLLCPTKPSLPQTHQVFRLRKSL